MYLRVCVCVSIMLVLCGSFCLVSVFECILVPLMCLPVSIMLVLCGSLCLVCNVNNRLLILFRKVHDVTLVWIFQFLLIMYRNVLAVTLVWTIPTCTTF